MNKFLSAILSLASLTTVFAATFDNQLKITDRLNAGTLLKDVERVHTVTVNGKRFVVEVEVNANMSHLRRLSTCSVTPEKCTGINTTWNN